jgi:hypothetical protein
MLAAPAAAGASQAPNSNMNRQDAKPAKKIDINK